MARERRRPRPLELESFRDDVVAGLSAPQKFLSPKYFYDGAGSRLFARICRLPEYYLTRAELALTRRHLAAIARFAGRGCQLIEYGSGEGVKSRLLIRATRPAVYVPIDISQDALDAAARRLAREFPGLRIHPLLGDFSRPIDIPVAMAANEALTRARVVRNDSLMRPWTTASITLLTPWRRCARIRARAPARPPPAAGTRMRSQTGSARMASTTFGAW